MLIQGAGVKSALAVFLFTSLVAERGEAYVYYCTLKEVVNLTSKGTIGPDFMKDLALQYPLVVDTETGKVLHPIFGNTSYDHLTVNPATKISAFQVIAEVEFPRPDAGVPIVREFAFFQLYTYEDPAEPSFLAIEGGEIASGVCK